MRNLQGKGLLGLFLLFLPTCSSQTLSCCHGDVRLVNGYTPNEGRVEVCLSNRWNTICNRSWDTTDAGVVCIQLGFMRQYAQVLTLTNGSFGSGSGSIVGNISCHGTEMMLTECTLYQNHYGYCTHSYDVGLRCATMCQTGAVRLQGGSRHGEGRVEVCKNGAWGTVCDDGWGSQDAKVVCRLLGFSSTNAEAHRSASHGQGSGPILIDDVMCSGNESSLFDCPHHIKHNCNHDEDASVTCQTNLTCQDGDVRLVNSASYSGRVEICLNKTWGTICDDGWRSQNANVTCRQLGYSGYSFWRTDNVNGIAFGDIHLTEVYCRGNETSLLECRYSVNTQSCLHNKDIGIECLTTRIPDGELNFIGGRTLYEGAVMIFLNDTWQHICFDGWDESDARVVCSQLGYSSTSTNVAAYRVELDALNHSNKAQIVLKNVTCSGRESQLTSCCATETQLLYCNSQAYAGVRCENSKAPTAAPTKVHGYSLNSTVVNTEQCHDKFLSALLGALTGVFAVIIIVLGIICICVLAYVYMKKKISDNIQRCHKDRSELVDSNDDQESTNTTSCQLKLSLHMPESMEKANSQISLDKITNPNSDSFEHLETKKEYSPNSPPPADEGNVYQPLSMQDRSEDATSNGYQSLTHSAEELECTTPGPPISLKASECLNLPHSSKQHTLSKQREFCFEDVVIKKRKL